MSARKGPYGWWGGRQLVKIRAELTSLEVYELKSCRYNLWLGCIKIAKVEWVKLSDVRLAAEVSRCADRGAPAANERHPGVNVILLNVWVFLDANTVQLTGLGSEDGLFVLRCFAHAMAGKSSCGRKYLGPTSCHRSRPSPARPAPVNPIHNAASPMLIRRRSLNLVASQNVGHTKDKVSETKILILKKIKIVIKIPSTIR